MQVMNHRTQLSETVEDFLSQWIKNQPFYKEHTNQSKDELPPEQVDVIISIRKRISAKTNH